DLGGERPARRGAGVAVQHDVHVDLARLGAHCDGRVGAQRVAPLLRLVAPRGVPGVGVAHEVLVAAVGRGEHELDPHVETRVAEEVEFRSGEGEPADAGRDLLDPRDLDVEEAPGRGRPGGTTGAGAGGDDGQAHTGEANLRAPRRVNPSRPLDGHRSGDPRHAPRPRLRHSRYTKYGAPSRAVPRPAGICPGAMTTRPSVSATETRSAPSSLATGTTRACRAPTTARAACGATGPTPARAPRAARRAPRTQAHRSRTPQRR